MSSSSTRDLPISTPLVVMKIKIVKRASDVFEGRNGLILTGILSGIGTIVCLLGLTLVIIYARKKYKRRKKTRHNGHKNSSFSKIKERISSEAGHPTLKGQFSHSPPLGDASAPSTQPSLHITDQRHIHNYFTQAGPVTPPFQNTLPYTDDHIPEEIRAPAQQAEKPSKRPYRSSSIPISSTPSGRRKISQSNNDHDHESSSKRALVGLAITTDEAVFSLLLRPSSFLPVPRGLTPLSMNFVYRTRNGGSSSPSSSASFSYAAGGSARPQAVAMPSSELMHDIQETIGIGIGSQEGEPEDEEGKSGHDRHGQIGEAISPFANVVHAHESAMLPSLTRRLPSLRSAQTQRRPLKTLHLWEQQRQLQKTADTAPSLSSSTFNYSYPATTSVPPIKRNEAVPPPSSHSVSHAHSRSTPITPSHNRADSIAMNATTSNSLTMMRHLRNRSNGTVVTYASAASSSAHTNWSNTTAKIQPVAFGDDSPRSSFSATRTRGHDRTEMQQEQHQQGQRQQIWHSGVVSNSERWIAPYNIQQISKAFTAGEAPKYNPGDIYTSQRHSQPLVGSEENISRGYKFPTVSTSHVIIPPSHQSTTIRQTDNETVQNVQKQGRRASGKLPDMLFSRTFNIEKGLTSPISPATSSSSGNTNLSASTDEMKFEEEEYIANIEDSSVLDPMDDVARRDDQLLYADIKLSNYSSIYGGIRSPNESMREELQEQQQHYLPRPKMGEERPSASSLMTSTSSTSTNTSYYGLAV
ncbi:hypothetical protein P389DRAFT_177479 [Cystobasidium minutum MCA 4210]|uniref:uncharacterized protein n=1 Tax=Cystobasidium minutum MCA 4210 TaxID=1397322 RepID=UPI0034CDE101|eukprot:jgi/Rhomi1/177479/fgenesh1_pg.1_\